MQLRTEYGIILHQHMNNIAETEEKKGYSVLIIEDDPFILELLVLKFTKKNWVVDTATDGETGLVKAEHAPDIVLLDISLPGISGYDVLKKMKTSDALKNVPVLILSNYGQKEEIEKSIALGAVDHLVKANIIIDEVVEHTREVIERTYSRTE